MRMQYDGELSILADDYGPTGHAVHFYIDFDYTPPVLATRDDPPWGAEVLVLSVQLRCNGEKVVCPKWLEQIILSAIDDEVLLEYAAEQ